MRIALFVTCLADAMFPDVGKATLRLLERLGHEVAFPVAQTCCGQMHGNAGYLDQGRGLARRWERVFSEEPVVVSPSASCVGYVRERVPSAVGRLFELSEFLVDRLGVTDVGASFPHRVTLHPTCHSLRLLHVGERPRRLLEAVRGIEGLTEIDRGLSMNPEEPEKAYFNRALANEGLDDMKAAYLDYMKALELAPNWDAPRHELTRFTVENPAGTFAFGASTAGSPANMA